jgi:hypothetical protein
VGFQPTITPEEPKIITDMLNQCQPIRESKLQQKLRKRWQSDEFGHGGN